MFSQDRSVRAAHSNGNTALRSLCTAFVLGLFFVCSAQAQVVVPVQSTDTTSTALDTAISNAIDTSNLSLDNTGPVEIGAQADSTPVRKNSMFHFDVKESLKHARVNINGLSYHFDRTNEHNERNWGIGLELPVTENSAWMVGYYHNSNWRPTTYAWYVKTPWKAGPVHFGWMAGVATGYHPKNNFTPIPVAGLTATIRNDKVGVNFVCLPPEVCAVGLSVRFW